MDAEQLKKITGYFILEAKEHLEVIAQSLQDFQETVDDPEQIQEIYRGAHSIKGGAAMLELESIRVIAHRLEDYFKLLKSSPLKVDETLVAWLSKAYNALDSLVDKLEETLSLPEDFTQTIMGKVEPLFEKISQHLDKLSTSPLHQRDEKGNLGNAFVLPQTFQEEVLQALAEIGELHEQGDSADRRTHIQTLCRHLAKLEDSSHRTEWTHFLEVAQTAIAYPKNDYHTTSQWILNDLKEAVAHLVAGEGQAIVPSSELLNLAQRVTKSTLSDVNSSELNDLADLFENDPLDLEQTWQEETIDSNEFVDSQETSLTDTDFGSLFDSPEPELSLGASVEADPELKDGLEDLFGSDMTLEETELMDSPPDRLPTSPGDRELLSFGIQEKQESATPHADFDSLDNLFGEGFSFEEDERLGNIPEFKAGSPEFSDSSNPELTAAPLSPTLNDDLNKDLDAIFSDIGDGETENLLQNPAFNLEISNPSDAAKIGNIGEPEVISAREEISTEPPELEDMRDLLDISVSVDTTPSSPEMAVAFDDFDPFETFVQSDILNLETTAPNARKSDPQDLGINGEFNPLFDGEESRIEDIDIEDIDDIDDLEAFLSGQTTPMSLRDRGNSQIQNKGELESDRLEKEIETTIPASGSQIKEGVKITLTPLEPVTNLEVSQDDEFIALLPGDNNMTNQEPEINDLDALLENIPDTAIAETVSEFSPEEEFADLGLLELYEDDTANETGKDLDLFSLDDGESSLSEASENSDDEDLFALFSGQENEAIATEDFDNLDLLLSDIDETTNLIEASSAGDSQEDDLAALLDLDLDISDDTDDAIALEETNSLEDLLADVTGTPSLEEILPESSPQEEELEESNALEDLLANEITAPETLPLSSQDELADLLADASIDDNASMIPELQEQEFAKLEAFLEGESMPELTPLPSEEPLTVPKTTDKVEEIATTPEDEFNYYDRLDELEAFLDKPALSAKDLQVATTFSELEALLEVEPTGTGDREEAKGNGEETPVVPRTSEEDFGDVEEMLLRAQQQAGEIPLESTKRSQRPTRPRTNKPKVEASLKVPVKQMDNLSNLVGELVVNRNSLEGDEERLRQFLDSLMHQVQNLSDVGGRMQDLYERSLLENALLRSRREYHTNQTNDFAHSTTTTDASDSGFDNLEMDSFSKFHELAQETIEMIVRVRESASDIQFLVDDIDQVARTLRQVTSQLQEGLTKSRMIPFGNTASRLPLAVRRIAPQLNKQAQLELEGQETLIDKMILEHLSDPLTHLVNNALTHGIELPEVRLASGKSQMGHIKVIAMQQGNQTVISVSDDGGGIDPDIVKQKAIQKGLIDRDRAKRLSRLDVYDLLFHPGFSTKDQADNFAGRGVGLDVVRTSINEIRGAVSIDSKLGKGTTFTIRLPLTLSICKALCCVSENAPISFPLDGVEDMIDLPHRKLQRNAQGQMCIPWRDTLLPYAPLSELLSYNRRIGRSNLYGGKREENVLSVVVLRGSGSHIAVGVDQVVGEQEIVIKQLYGPIPKPAGIAGATVQGDGKIMAIADVLELIEISEGRIRKDMGSAMWETTGTSNLDTDARSLQDESIVLIVDDSITVRELLSMSFSKSGYRVEQARDGQDAWDKLRSGMPCDIVFCDIEMPRVDGLEFLGRVQKDEELCDIPVAMLTSRGADRHRKVAAELGASGYFTKPYLEEVLLDAAERMIDGEVLLEGSTRKVREARPRASKRAESAAMESPTLVQTSETMIIQPTVLIIDDSVTVRSLLSMTFENAGYHVEQARDGKEAWEKLKGGLTPDIALCDIEMPRLDGLELLGKIYENEELQRIPVAMLTSRGAERHRKVAAERGASGYFTKPYVEQELLAAADRIRNGEVLLKNSIRQPGITTSGMSESINREQASGNGQQGTGNGQRATGNGQQGTGNGQQKMYSAPQTPNPPSQTFIQGQPKVLIIDDSVTVRSLLSMTFEKAGYVVEQARDGKEALDKLQGGLNPHVVFCDIEMPKMDGLKLIATLQDDEKLNKIPVAMLTSRGAKKHQMAAAERGAKGYFTKPYVEDVLLDAAQRLMNGEVLLKVEA
ncbi:response regulator [Spirulina sp. 06S082]|uniref:hybrid sensor histidine kinase/response regulator n=1 Tax=Spirulina sp. 06S082 TaxID=3110248 RepID=UPI002B21E5AC|nr:response regulator [Spirulina sp. 06S082]MEA5469546.1 response regulator [Spirulina sp. 06S082]